MANPGAPAGFAGCGWPARLISCSVATACDATAVGVLPSKLLAVIVYVTLSGSCSWNTVTSLPSLFVLPVLLPTELPRGSVAERKSVCVVSLPFHVSVMCNTAACALPCRTLGA